MSPNLPSTVTAFCHKHGLFTPGDRLVVGVSGGPDSLCLLHLLHTLRNRFDLSLTVAHLDHRLRGAESAADARFVANLARQWGLPSRVEQQPVGDLAAARGQSVEEAARQVRYAFLWRVAAETGSNKVAVGHHGDDQAETVLMHFIRGSGLTGLRGMRPLIQLNRLRLHPDDLSFARSENAPQLIRPLLDISRSEIEAYCQAHQLTPRRDATNRDLTFFRNNLRHKLLPQLESYNPNIRQTLQHTAKVATAEVELLQAQLERAWSQVVRVETGQQITFERAGWLDLPLALKRSTLRRAVQHLRRSLRDITFVHIENAVEIAQAGPTGAQATFPQSLILRVNYDTLTLASETGLDPLHNYEGPYLQPDKVLMVEIPGFTVLAEAGWGLRTTIRPGATVTLERLKTADRWIAHLDADRVAAPVQLRTRRPGDSFCPLGMAGRHKKLNEFMINEKIPAAWRNYLPLLVSKEQILWVCGYRPDDRVRVRSATKRVLRLKFERLSR